MSYRRTFAASTIGALAVMLLLSLVLSHGVEADSREVGFFGKLVAGTYVVSLEPADGISRILTISADGNLSSIQSTQFATGAGGLSFSNQQGAYKHTGPREITATVVDIDTDPVTNEFRGIAIAIYVLKFDPSFNSVKGTVDGKTFAAGVNPLNPGGATPLATFTDAFKLAPFGRTMLLDRRTPWDRHDTLDTQSWA
jgi:hypothetical protein